MKAKRPITAPRRIQLAGLTACCACGARLLLPKTPEGAILASQRPGIRGMSVQVVSPKVLTWRLKAVMDAPIDIDGKIMVLRYTPDTSGHGGDFRVEEIRR